MKNVLFILLIFPSFCFGQTLALDYTASTGTIDSYTFPKNTLSYGLTSATNIRIFVDGIGAVWGSRPYTDFTYNGGAFPSLDSLSSWLNANMFGDTTSAVVDTATLESVTTGTGSNVTPNAIHVTGYANIVLDKNSTALLEQGTTGGVYRIDSTIGNIIGSVEISNTVVALTADGGASTLNVRPETGVASSVLVSGRISADAGINPTDVVVKSQIDIPNIGITELQTGQTLLSPAVYTYTGGTGSAFPLQPVLGNEGKAVTIINQSAETISINSASGGNDILINGGNTNNVVLNPSDVLVLSNNSSKWVYQAGIKLSLGEDLATAYRGDRGKTAYDHSQITDGTNPHATTFANIASLPTTIAGYGITNAIISGGQTTGSTLNIGNIDNNAVSILVNNSAVASFRVGGNFQITNNVIQNSTTPNNSTITLGAGVTIARNLADAVTLAKFNNTNASSTGNAAEFQKAGVTNASISNLGVITGLSFVKTGGTSAQFLKADGSVDASSYTLSSKFVTATSPTLTFGEIPAHSFIDLGLDVTGAAFGDIVTLGIPNAAFVNGAMFNAMVSNDSPGVVTIRCANITASPITIPGGVYKVTIIK